MSLRPCALDRRCGVKPSQAALSPSSSGPHVSCLQIDQVPSKHVRTVIIKRLRLQLGDDASSV